MTKHEFLEHIENPFLLSEKTLSEYEKLVAKYPFCSTIWLLYLKNLQLVNDIRFDEMLKRGAVACPDRSKLFTLIHQQPESNIEKVEPAITEEKETKTETPEQEVKTEAQKPAKVDMQRKMVRRAELNGCESCENHETLTKLQ